MFFSTSGSHMGRFAILVTPMLFVYGVAAGAQEKQPAYYEETVAASNPLRTEQAKEQAPLVISMHGGGGSSEVALFHGGANYHDMVRGGVKRGYVVFAPQHLFSAEGFPKDIRNRIDERLRLVGTSLTAIEIVKIAR